MITSVHIAEFGLSGAMFRGVKPAQVPGLLSADGGPLAQLGPAVLPRPDIKRIGMVAFWESEDALDDFVTSNPTGKRLAEGWQARLSPLRAYGTWPGLPADTPKARTVTTEGPVAVTTLAKLKLAHAYRFFKTSATAEARVVTSPGLIWASGFGGLPFAATQSLWESAQAAHDYAYGAAQPEHSDAVEVDRVKTFHREKAFVRYEILSVSGEMTGGSNPIPAFDLPKA